MASSGRACVVGAGPNGLAAAIVLAQAGLEVEVFEAETQPGGGARTMDLTLPGFHHDFGSAVHPLAAASPILSSLPLAQFGLDLIQPDAPLAHPLDGGRVMMLEQDLTKAADKLGKDGKAWQRLMRPLVDNWPDLSKSVLGPIELIPRHPFLMARFALAGIPPATFTANRLFKDEGTKALFAGLAAHSFLSLDEATSAAFGVVLGVTAHRVGWPIPRGGSQAITTALIACLESLGGKVTTGHPIEDLEELKGYDVTLCNVTPRQFLGMAKSKLSEGQRKSLESYRYGPAVFKIDYALSAPIPWTNPECARAATVHIGGTMEEMRRSESMLRSDHPCDRPFCLLAQPSLFDDSRAPTGKHTAWVYCHVPHGYPGDMTETIENQIERFAPGFRDVVLAKSTLSPKGLQAMDGNLIGGDINGGALDFGQMLFRPTRRLYESGVEGVYLCSSSTPPGGGVHGMCGYHAAQRALKWLKR